MPGHSTLWSPDRYIKALRRHSSNLRKQDLLLLADEVEGASRMLWKLWKIAEPEAADAARGTLFEKETK